MGFLARNAADSAVGIFGTGGVSGQGGGLGWVREEGVIGVVCGEVVDMKRSEVDATNADGMDGRWNKWAVIGSVEGGQ